MAHHIEKRATEVKGVPHGIKQTRLRLTDWLTDWLWSWFLVEKIVPQLVNLFTTFYGNWMVITGTCPFPELDQSSPLPPPCVLKFLLNVILISTPKSSKCPLSVRFPHQILYAPVLFPICTTCPSNLILVDLIAYIVIGEECSWNSIVPQ